MNTERRALWTLAIPVIMTNGAMRSLGGVDMSMVGRLGPTAIASLSVSVTWMFAIGVFGLSGSVRLGEFESDVSEIVFSRFRKRFYWI